MKQFIALILFIGLNTQCLMKLGIMTWYSLNKEYITNRFCVNKAKPAMHCNGKCYLKKQLDKSEKNSGAEGSQKLPEKTDTVYLLAVVPEEMSLSIKQLILTEAKYRRYQSELYSEYNASVFHPPPIDLFG